MSAVKNISLFVPFVFPNFDQKYVAEAFADYGDVDRVDFVSKLDRDGNPFHSAYIHFKTWYEEECSIDLQRQIETKGSAQLYHDDTNYYWIVLPNTSKKHNPALPRTRIDLGEDKAINFKVEEKEADSSDQKIRQIVEIIDSYEHDLSDGFGYYAHHGPSYILEKIAKRILRLFEGPTKKSSTETPVTKPPSSVPTTPFIVEEWDVQASEEAAQMAEIEAELEAEDAELVSVDKRYLKLVEEENLSMRCEVTILRQAIANLDLMYRAEVAKVRAFTNV